MKKQLLLLLLLSISIHIGTAGSLECVPQYLACQSGGCALFADQCDICHADEIVCPDGESCVSDFADCPIDYPFRNQSLSIEDRVNDLIGRLTIEEKVNQLQNNRPAIKRLGITAYANGNEATHGLTVSNVTVFPQAIAAAATFDRGYVHSMSHAISDEARVYHRISVQQGLTSSGLNFYAPVINIPRDPRWGRTQETYGEDPYLSGQMAVEYVKGLQTGSQSQYLKASACCKHSFVYNLEHWDLNLVNRHNFDAKVSPYDLEATYFPSFEACVREGKAEMLMCSYNSINGIPACAHGDIQNKIVREKWGFDGYIVSDFGAIADMFEHHKWPETPDASSAAIAGIVGGCDMDGGGSDYPDTLAQSVEEGRINETFIDTALGRIFKNQFKLGLMDNPWGVQDNFIPTEKLNSPEHHELARDGVRKSMVLLKNDGVLPLSPNPAIPYKKIASIGPFSDECPTHHHDNCMLGDYEGKPSEIVTPYQGIKHVFEDSDSGNTEVVIVNAAGCKDVLCILPWEFDFKDAKEAAKDADIVILHVGINIDIETEGRDRQLTTGLPGEQDHLIKDVIKSAPDSTPIIVVLYGAGALTVSHLNDDPRINAIVHAWYPGMMGGHGIADILFGNASPAGRLVETFVKSVDDLPNYLDVSMTLEPGRTYRYFSKEPLWPFGYGLSYADFKYSNLVLSSEKINVCQSVFITVTIENTAIHAEGLKSADEVVQVYAHVNSTSANVPIVAKTQLVNFDRVSLEVGKPTEITLEITPRAMSVVTTDGIRVVSPSGIEVFVGGGQPGYYAGGLSAYVEIDGNETPIDEC